MNNCPKNDLTAPLAVPAVNIPVGAEEGASLSCLGGFSVIPGMPGLFQADEQNEPRCATQEMHSVL